MRTVITSAPSGINGDCTSCITVIVDSHSEPVVSSDICYSSYAFEILHDTVGCGFRLEIDRLPGQGVEAFLQSFTECGMGMHVSCQLGGGEVPQLRECQLG